MSSQPTRGTQPLIVSPSPSLRVSASPRALVSVSPRALCSTPLPLVASTWLAESVWIYLVFASVVAQSNPGNVFTPAAVLLPYGMAALTTLLLGSLARVDSTPRFLNSALSTRHSALNAWMAALFVALQLLESLVSLLLAVWWELHRSQNPLDPSWLSLALAEARGPANALPPMAWLVMLGVFLWWRGNHLPHERTGFPPLLSRFSWGTAGLLILESFGGSAPLGPVVPWLLGSYLLLGLVTLALARLEMARAERLGDVDQGWRWRGSILAMLVVMIGFGVGLLLLPQIGDLAAWAWNSLAAPLLSLLLDLLRWIAHLLGWDQPPTPVPLPLGEGMRTPSGERTGFPTLPEWLREAGRMMFNLCWISAILFALYSWVRRWRWHGRAGTAGGTTRSRIPWKLRLRLRAVLLWLLRRLAARWPILSRWLPLSHNAEERLSTMRQLYRKLLAWGTSHGSAREGWATPREYQATLSAKWPALAEEFATLTESYLRARYGGPPLDRDELEATMAGWLRIAKTGDSL